MMEWKGISLPPHLPHFKDLELSCLRSSALEGKPVLQIWMLCFRLHLAIPRSYQRFSNFLSGHLWSIPSVIPFFPYFSEYPLPCWNPCADWEQSAFPNCWGCPSIPFLVLLKKEWRERGSPPILLFKCHRKKTAHAFLEEMEGECTNLNFKHSAVYFLNGSQHLEAKFVFNRNSEGFSI